MLYAVVMIVNQKIYTNLKTVRKKPLYNVFVKVVHVCVMLTCAVKHEILSTVQRVIHIT